MITPPNPYPNSDPLKRMTQRMQQRKVDSQVLEILQQVFEKELEQENILLSRPERIRLFRQTAKVVLTDMLAKIERDS